MYIVKQNLKEEKISFAKILNRVQKQNSQGNLNLELTEVLKIIYSKLFDKITSDEVENEIIDTLAYKSIEEPLYSHLAARIFITRMHKKITSKFSLNFYKLFELDLVDRKFYRFVKKHAKQLDEAIDLQRDFQYTSIFSLYTFRKSYMLKPFDSDKVMETPQFVLCRVAVQVGFLEGIDFVLQVYKSLSTLKYTQASPTIFNSCTKVPALASCFLLSVEDSVQNIYETLKTTAMISKSGGGIGVDFSKVRSKGSLIRSTNGASTGIVKAIQNFNMTALYVNQCFTPDTWVYCKTGPKEMQDVTAQDELITIDGTYKKVNEVIVNQVEKELLEIRATNTLFPVKVTKEHDLYLLKNQKKITNATIRNRLEKGILKADFYKAGEVGENDFVGFPVPTYEKDNDEYDEEFCKFYGMMLGDGHVTKNKNEYGITLGDAKKSDLQDFVRYFLEKRSIHYWESKYPGCTAIKWSGNPLKLNLARKMLYDSENQKRLKEDFLHLPKNKIEKLLEGLLKTDGSNSKEVYYGSVSKELIMQMRYLFLRLGVLTSGYIRDNIGKRGGRGIVTRQLYYVLRVPRHANLSNIIDFKNGVGQHFKYFEFEGILWGRVKAVKKISYKGDVYDFNMVDNHNYLTDMGLVHNSGKRKGSFAIYLHPSHPDFMDFLELRTNTGGDEMKARDLFYGIWASNTFMEYIKDPKEQFWYFFDPNTQAGLELDQLYGKEHTKRYKELVLQNKYSDKIETQKIWMAILNTQVETGMPYFCFRDHANLKSNLRHSAEIRSSNLCVSGTTLMLTKDGYYPMAELEDCTVEAWNGFEFSTVTVRRTAERATMKKIFFNNGLFIECTPEHNFFVQRGTEVVKIPAKELRKGFMLAPYNMPIITNERGEVDFSAKDCGILSPPFQGSRKQIEAYILKHYKNSKTPKTHVQQLVAFLLCQQLTGQKDVQTFVYKIDEENVEGPTFCATEPLRGKLTFNGVTCGNCAEILLPASEEKKEIGTCNLASVSLKHHVNVETKSFDFEALQETVKQVTRNLNQIIDCMHYSHPYSENSNKKHRPIGIGVQGLADTFYLLQIPFDSEEAIQLNKRIFENIYFAAYEESADLAIEYPEKIPKSFKNSPLSQGKLQFDLWAEESHFDLKNLTIQEEKWNTLKEKIKNTGVVNMAMTSVMPTATTSQIMENYEAIEPPMSIIFNRSTLSGNFPVINKYLIKDLQELNLWTETVRQSIVETGTIQHLKNSIPFNIRNLYKTIWEIDQKVLVNLSADRGPFIDHSQSLNLSFSGLSTKQDITECLFLAYKRGLKTGVYYTRTKPAVAQKYTAATCSLENKECEMCSS